MGSYLSYEMLENGLYFMDFYNYIPNTAKSFLYTYMVIFKVVHTLSAQFSHLQQQMFLTSQTFIYNGISLCHQSPSWLLTTSRMRLRPIALMYHPLPPVILGDSITKHLNFSQGQRHEKGTFGYNLPGERHSISEISMKINVLGFKMSSSTVG